MKVLTMSLVACLGLGTSEYARAQSGTVRGSVRESLTGEGVPESQVLVVGTTLETWSDSFGNFTLNNVPLGSYRIVALKVGFRVEPIGIDVIADSTISVTIEVVRVGSLSTITVDGGVVQRPCGLRFGSRIETWYDDLGTTGRVRLGISSTADIGPVGGWHLCYHLASLAAEYASQRRLTDDWWGLDSLGQETTWVNVGWSIASVGGAAIVELSLWDATITGVPYPNDRNDTPRIYVVVDLLSLQVIGHDVPP